ncbi:MAG: hypothetical protein LBJ73_00945 [Rickettsiales bacterium]|jgi:tRNA (guanine-N7-)-methyltransferase|nr:hypothetical protein [Rickettsiales bacterium]
MKNQSGIRKYEQGADYGPIRTFGRVHGKKLSARQQWLVENLLPVLLPVPHSLRGEKILEIGFGNGEHLREVAIGNPDAIVIGAEPFINGVASLLSSITEIGDIVKPEYRNICIWPDDVRKLLSRISYLLSAIYILHPDPWPKARHEKRRLLNADFLNLLASRLDADGQIIIGTDHHEYYDWIVAQVKNTDLKIKTTKMEIIRTRYQKKNKAETSAPKYLVLSR